MAWFECQMNLKWEMQEFQLRRKATDWLFYYLFFLFLFRTKYYTDSRQKQKPRTIKRKHTSRVEPSVNSVAVLKVKRGGRNGVLMSGKNTLAPKSLVVSLRECFHIIFGDTFRRAWRLRVARRLATTDYSAKHSIAFNWSGHGRGRIQRNVRNTESIAYLKRRRCLSSDAKSFWLLTVGNDCPDDKREFECLRFCHIVSKLIKLSNLLNRMKPIAKSCSTSRSEFEFTVDRRRERLSNTAAYTDRCGWDESCVVRRCVEDTSASYQR